MINVTTGVRGPALSPAEHIQAQCLKGVRVKLKRAILWRVNKAKSH
jgi:hypothetical protein